MINNLGEGSIPKLMAKLAIPAVVAQVVNLLYNIVDRIYIGHIPQIGADALTGVGLFTPVIIKFVFHDAVRKNKSANYICVNLFEAAAPVDIQDRSICISADCGRVIEDLLEVKNKNI